MRGLEASIQAKRSEFRVVTLSWADSNARRYPWREKGRTPYEILVAELLLKRTTATAAVRTYHAFLSKYPSVDILAQASEEELAQDFKSIGLYAQRARAASQLALYLIEEEAGSIPNTLDRLIKTPGLGNYSARAILSFGYDRASAIVDANITRVLARVFNHVTQGHPTINRAQEIADSILPEESHRKFNFALLDLGALVCRYANPRCRQCPLSHICDYAAVQQRRQQSPEPVPSKLRQQRIAKGYSLAQLAIEANVSKLTIINIEAGRTLPLPKTLNKLAAALGIPATVLAARRNPRSREVDTDG